jgi:hypothetical protein
VVVALALGMGCDAAGTSGASDTVSEVADVQDAVDSGADTAQVEDTTAPDDSAAPDDTTVADTADTVPADTQVEADTSAPEDVAEVVVPTEKFSFFVTSYAAIQRLSGSVNGFGGDLRYGETGPGAGLRGADKICATIAEQSMKGAGAKGWRAFLSAADDGNGVQVDAIDRIGEGPWYDRLGRKLADKKADLLNDRPTSADAAIKNDFPNEDGVPNHRPDPTQGQVDNHDILTGTNNQGKLYAATATCLDWTANAGNKTLEGKPRVGHSWPRNGGPGGGGGGPGGDMNPANWMSSLTESGCAPGVNLIETGPPSNSANTVGNGGGYGGFYCFALSP